MCRRLLKLARDNSLWRNKCFEKAPSSSSINIDQPEALSDLTGALGGLSLSDSPSNAAPHQPAPSRINKRVKKIAQWDHTGEDEHVDWYTEYIARHAPLYTTWSETPVNEDSEVRGVAVNARSTYAVGCREDGSVAIWDIQQQAFGGRRFRQVAESDPGILFHPPGQSSSKPVQPSFSGITESIHLDSTQNRAYVAVDRTLNEVDLETMKVISQESYAWRITAVSQQGNEDVPLSIGTTWSLHLYDPRVPLRDRSRSPEDLMRSMPGDPEESIAFLPNYNKDTSSTYRPLPTSLAPTDRQLAPSSARSSRRGRTELSDYAHVEPGPLSILHHGDNDIIVAGRFPSILSYDRRFFPRLQSVIHSGARLSALSSIPYAPKAAQRPAANTANSTLLACGEYGGRGSLELYSLPYSSQPRQSPTSDYGLGSSSPELSAADREFALDATPSPTQPYSYRNRQEASSAKLLSVATQGTRIVFSDAEGGLKWVERDGRGLVRRWNINEYSYDATTGAASATGELVARKIVPLAPAMPLCDAPAAADDGGRGEAGNGELLIWTGEKLGIVGLGMRYEDHEALVNAFEEEDKGDERGEKERAEEYGRAMRRALERQADERRWMSRFRLKRGLF